MHQHQHRLTTTNTKKELLSSGDVLRGSRIGIDDRGNKEGNGDIEMDMQSHGTRQRRASSELSAECFSPIVLQLHNNEINNNNNGQSHSNNGSSNGNSSGNGNGSGGVDKDKNGLASEGDDQLKTTSADTDPGSVDRLMPAVVQASDKGSDKDKGSGSGREKNSKKGSDKDRVSGLLASVVTDIPLGYGDVRPMKGDGGVGEERLQLQLQLQGQYSMNDSSTSSSSQSTLAAAQSKEIIQAEEDEEDEDEDEDILGFWYSIVWLAVITVFISFLSDALVDSITAASAGMKVTDPNLTYPLT